MDKFNPINFLNKVNNSQSSPQPSSTQSAGQNSGAKFELPIPPQETPGKMAIPRQVSVQSALIKGINPVLAHEMRMNSIANLERSLYVKDIMNLPKEMAQALAVLQKTQVAGKEVAELLSKNISLLSINELIQKNGKEAMNKLIFSMSEAAKQGIETSQLKETFKLINASVSVAANENNAQILKSFMLLYLPWLPLQEGNDFDFELDIAEAGGEDSESSITILISTKNFGNIKAILTLLKGNSIDILINCSNMCPKQELLNRMNNEGKKHSIQSNTTIEQQESKNSEATKNTQAKVSMSNITEINPFLLLMAHALIRHTIELDTLQVNG